MTLPDIKQLKELLKLLRAQGVLNYNTPELQLILSEQAPITITSGKSPAQEIMEDEDELTPEQEKERLMFYSADAPIDTES